MNLLELMKKTVAAYHGGTLRVSEPFLRLMGKIVAASPHTMGLERTIGVYEKIKCNLNHNMTITPL